MSQKQPEALRLADELENSSVYEASGLVVWGWAVGHESNPTDDAADELRRLHAANELMRGEIMMMRDVLASLERDAARIDWLADLDNKIGAVLLPAEIVMANMGSLRDQIDAAMEASND